MPLLASELEHKILSTKTCVRHRRQPYGRSTVSDWLAATEHSPLAYSTTRPLWVAAAAGLLTSSVKRDVWAARKYTISMTHRTTRQQQQHPFNVQTTRVSRYQKGKTDLDFTEGRDSEWQWHQLGHMQIGTSPQTDNHASTLSLSCFTVRMPPPSCRSTNSVKASKGSRQQIVSTV